MSGEPAPGAAPGEDSPPPPIKAALNGLCPRCGTPGLFAGWLSFADRCRTCGLDFAAFNVGDGPAAFLTMIWGAVIVAGGAALQLTLDPPWWVQALIWVPFTLVAVVLSLRVSKAALLVLEYRHRAGEARSADPR